MCNPIIIQLYYFDSNIQIMRIEENNLRHFSRGQPKTREALISTGGDFYYMLLLDITKFIGVGGAVSAANTFDFKSSRLRQ